jgi:tRNA(fMet)-specific endonuclease VapC
LEVIVADSDVLIDALRGREPAAGRVTSEIEGGNLATTSINVFELLSGTKTGTEREKVERLLSALAILTFDERAGIASAEIRRELEHLGTAIGMADYLIAGICLSRSVPLLTRNQEHFGRVPGLALGAL